MTHDVPQVRAPLSKAILDVLDRQPVHVRGAVRRRAPAEIARVEEASRVDWIPRGVQLAILDAVRQETSLAGYEDFCAAHFASTVEQPFVKGMFETTTRLFGLHPGSVLRVFPKTWSTISRRAGRVDTGEIDPQGTLIHVRELPTEEPHVDLFAVGFRATFRGILEIFRRPGDVELVSYQHGASESVYRIRWE
ncbi:MAG: hypothetical protein IT378_11525 [Sandaracinaceae bacterium]|nr:hypothetical protein [Sandaracinaceae bacterium]